MKHKLVDHLFTKIIEGKHDKAISIVAVKAAIERVESVGEVVRRDGGNESLQNVFRYKEVVRALTQCLDYIENDATIVTDDDFAIYYDFAKNKLLKAESIIDAELSHLGL